MQTQEVNHVSKASGVIGNTTNYFETPCPYTVSYYKKQINDALQLAFRENPAWREPKSKGDIIRVIDSIQEWYHPFMYTALESDLFERLWDKAKLELHEMLLTNIRDRQTSRASRKRGNPRKKNRPVKAGQDYSPEVLKAIIEELKAQGKTVRTIGVISGVNHRTIHAIVKGHGTYAGHKLTKTAARLVVYLQSLGYDTKEKNAHRLHGLTQIKGGES